MVGDDTATKGKLDAAGTLSAAGLAAAVATAVTGVADWTVSDGEDRRVGLVWLAVASFCVFGNMTEAFIVYQSPFWMVVVAAAVAPRATRAMEPESPT